MKIVLKSFSQAALYRDQESELRRFDEINPTIIEFQRLNKVFFKCDMRLIIFPLTAPGSFFNIFFNNLFIKTLNRYKHIAKTQYVLYSAPAIVKKDAREVRWR